MPFTKEKKEKKNENEETINAENNEDAKSDPADVQPIQVDELAVLDNKYRRALADYQNLLKQTANEKTEFIKYANERILLEILPVYDNLKISLSHIDEVAKTSGWAEGVKYIVKQFKDVLENFGVSEIRTDGEKFDPSSMEAISGQGEKVVKELKPGYRLNGRVVIAARVEVGEEN